MIWKGNNYAYKPASILRLQAHTPASAWRAHARGAWRVSPLAMVFAVKSGLSAYVESANSYTF
jgi:hypothetical protein